MPSPHFRVAVQPGEGIVARFGTAVVIADAATGLDTFTDVVLDELDAASGEVGDDLVWRIAAQLCVAPQDAPAFGLLFATAGGYRVFLHGRARAVVNGQEQLTGTSALTWVDAEVTGPVHDIALTLVEEGDVMPDARSDLRGGTMSGVGLVLRPSGSHAAVPQAAPVAPPQPQPEPEPLPQPEPEPQPTPEPEPVPEPQPEAEPEPPAFAAIAPVPIPLTKPEPEPAAAEPNPTEVMPAVADTESAGGQRHTAVGALVSDDGTRTPLDRPYVFGREPQQDQSVQDGRAMPLRLSDPEQLISRVQAYVFVDGGQVTIKDAKSANGTFIAAPGAPDWVRLGEEPAELPVGWSVRMGRRVFTHYGADR